MSSTSKIAGLFVFILIIIAASIYIIMKDFGGIIASNGAAGSGSMSKQEVEKIINDYLMNNPELITKSLQAYQQKIEAESQKNVQASLKANRDKIENNPTSPTLGNLNGDITLTEFFDYSCGYCKKAFAAIAKLIENDKNIKVVLKEYPILGPGSLVAAKISLAVHKIAPDKYFDFHAKLINGRASSQTAVLKIAEDLGIDVKKLKEAIKDPEIDKIIIENRALANSLGIRGTPAFIIGNTLVPGAISYEDMAKIVDAERSGESLNIINN